MSGTDALGIAMIVLLIGVPAAVIWTLWTLIVNAPYRFERTRADALREWAHANGFTFDPTNTRLILARYQGIPFFAIGTSQHACNTMTTTVTRSGRDYLLRFGDLYYTVGLKRQSIVHTSYLAIESPFEKMPRTTIRPERSSVMQQRDIDFEDAEFSNMFLVHSSSRRFAYDLLHPRAIEFLKAHAAGWLEIEVAGSFIALIDTSRHQPLREPPAFLSALAGLPISDDTRWPVPVFGQHVGLALSILELFPEHLARDLEAGPA